MKTQSMKVYVEVLVKTLEDKIELLSSIQTINMEQERLIVEDNFDYDKFDSLMGNKQVLLEQVNDVDEIFETNYQRVKDDLTHNKKVFQSEIEQMQQFIGKLTQQSVAITASELRIKQGVESSVLRLRTKVKQFHQNSRTANRYYKNMAHQHMGQSYFLDKKK